MTSPAVSIPLTYAGFDLQNLDGRHLEITQGLNDSPTVRGVDVTVPGSDGQVARPRRFHERRILLTGFIRGDGNTELDRRADYRDTMRATLSLFDPAAEPEDLVAYLEDGDVATIACRTLSVISVERVQSEWADVSIELLAVEDWTFEAGGS